MRSFYGRVGVEIDDTITGSLDMLESSFRAIVSEAVLNAAEPIRDRAHDLANVSPGELGNARDGRHMRDCIDIVLIDKPGSINARIQIDMQNVPYAAHQEFGMHGKPFLRPAFDESRQEVHQRLKDNIRAGISSTLSVRTAVRFRRFA